MSNYVLLGLSKSKFLYDRFWSVRYWCLLCKKLCHMLMTQNINNDVSQDSPISALSSSRALPRETATWDHCSEALRWQYLKTMFSFFDQMFSFHSRPEKFENAAIAGHFGFVFEEKSCRQITWQSFLKSFVFNMFFVHSKTQSWCFQIPPVSKAFS